MPAQQASVFLKSTSRTTRPKSNSSASAEPGRSVGLLIAGVYEKAEIGAMFETMADRLRHQ